ncbi:hypothetical protein G4X40_15870 [Rhodococcus sp. D2-41]|uniref:Transmembrane protein n=1 Tax=Speluncibacter jeojiensis TaxID=2710754 RepID=A0A9X4RDX0_9ACTN|nr:hypothetical protein [Rhodococcus sp. D2-41]MDG3011621.1 hypothetical protein [Rhodococcus sp. D2-41]MDG3015023.1 hypothetical protein [Corynebacteriales bacterium D3-21]
MFWRSLHPKDPLTRRSDLIETLLTATAIVALIALFPVASWLGLRTWSSQSALASRQQADAHQISAVTLVAAPAAAVTSLGYAGDKPLRVDADWAWQGHPHRGPIDVDYGTPKGTTVQTWVDDAGNPTARPLTGIDAQSAAIMVGLSTWLAGLMALAACWGFGRYRIWCSRDAQWDRELARFLGPAGSHR